MADTFRAGIAQLVRDLFGDPALAGVTVRTLAPAGGPRLTLAYIADLMEPGALQTLVLQPLAGGLPYSSPEQMELSGFFPAPALQVGQKAQELQMGLLDGFAALQPEGCPSFLLIGTGQAAPPSDGFGPDLGKNLALVRRYTRTPALRVERWRNLDGNAYGIAYVEGAARPEVLLRMRAWADQLSPRPVSQSWWLNLRNYLRLPPVLESTSPAQVADQLSRGYVAILSDHLPSAQMGPLTLELLFGDHQDTTLPNSVRRLSEGVRVGAAIIALGLSAALVAITSYHHALLPGPFLMALASGRRNMPLPIAAEVILIQLVSDAMWTGAARIGGRRWTVLAVLGTSLIALTALAAGFLAPIPVTVGILSTLAVQLMPNATLGRAVRAWRYLFTGAAVGLGMFGMALVAFALMVYLAYEQPFGFPLRRSMKAVNS